MNPIKKWQSELFSLNIHCSKNRFPTIDWSFLNFTLVHEGRSLLRQDVAFSGSWFWTCGNFGESRRVRKISERGAEIQGKASFCVSSLSLSLSLVQTTVCSSSCWVCFQRHFCDIVVWQLPADCDLIPPLGGGVREGGKLRDGGGNQRVWEVAWPQVLRLYRPNSPQFAAARKIRWLHDVISRKTIIADPDRREIVSCREEPSFAIYRCCNSPPRTHRTRKILKELVSLTFTSPLVIETTGSVDFYRFEWCVNLNKTKLLTQLFNTMY